MAPDHLTAPGTRDLPTQLPEDPLFQGRNANGFSSVYYHAWNACTLSWIGPVTTIAEGVSTNFQYGIQDIEVDAKGRVVISYNCAEPGGGQPWFNSWWSSIVRVAQPPVNRVPTAAHFGPGYPVNALPNEAFGVNLHGVGECMHVVFFATESGANKIYYRGFDTNNETWKCANTWVASQAQQACVNASITTDDDCTQCDDYRIYILFLSRDSGGLGSGPGTLWLSCAINASCPSFATSLVDVDTSVEAGRHYTHFTLANGPNREVSAVYSKRSETLRNLWARRYVNCAPTGPACTIEPTNILNRFLTLTGSRSSLVMSNAYVTVSDGNDVWLYHQHNTARTVSYNRYTGTRPRVPRLSATNTPTSNNTFCVTICDVPASMPGVLYFGNGCAAQWALPAPFDPGSFLQQDIIAAIPYSTTVCVGGGKWAACFSSPNLSKGQSIYLVAVQIVDFPTQVVPSNSMAVVFDL